MGHGFLRCSQAEVIPTDKDGGYALVHVDCMKREYSKILRGDSYRLVEDSTYFHEEIVSEYVLLCKRISQKIDDLIIPDSFLRCYAICEMTEFIRH